MSKNKKSPEHCPHCGKHCLLTSPGCKKGREYASKLANKNIILARKGLGYTDMEEQLQHLICQVASDTCLGRKELLLLELLHKGEMSEGEIRQNFSITKKEARKLLEKTEAKGLLVRVHTSEGTDSMILLTERGVQKAGAIHETYRAQMRSYFAILQEEDRIQLEGLLIQLIKENHRLTKEEAD